MMEGAGGFEARVVRRCEHSKPTDLRWTYWSQQSSELFHRCLAAQLCRPLGRSMPCHVSPRKASDAMMESCRSSWPILLIRAAEQMMSLARSSASALADSTCVRSAATMYWKNFMATVYVLVKECDRENRRQDSVRSDKAKYRSTKKLVRDRKFYTHIYMKACKKGG